MCRCRRRMLAMNRARRCRMTLPSRRRRALRCRFRGSNSARGWRRTARSPGPRRVVGAGATGRASGTPPAPKRRRAAGQRHRSKGSLQRRCLAGGRIEAPPGSAAGQGPGLGSGREPRPDPAAGQGPAAGAKPILCRHRRLWYSCLSEGSRRGLHSRPSRAITPPATTAVAPMRQATVAPSTPPSTA